MSYSSCTLFFHAAAIGRIEEKTVVAFLSFRFDYTCAEISEMTRLNIYVSTAIVQKPYRGGHITDIFYQHLKSMFPGRNIYVRTWGTNAGHLKILQRQEFKMIYRIPNDRGEGIDTIYFMFSGLS